MQKLIWLVLLIHAHEHLQTYFIIHIITMQHLQRWREKRPSQILWLLTDLCDLVESSDCPKNRGVYVE